MKHKGLWYTGVLLVTLGFILLFIQFTHGVACGLLGWGRLWPLLVLYVGFAFWLPLLLWWPRRAEIAGLAMPASILTMNGALLLYQAVTRRWASWAYLWPLELVAVAFGLVAIYALGQRDRGLLTAAGIVGGIGLLFLLILGTAFSPWLRLALPTLLIVAGLLLFLRGSRQRAQEDRPRP